MSPTFAEKTKKTAQKAHGEECPECGAEIKLVKHIDSVDNGKSLKFKTRIVKVCDCNKKEVYK
ncbi:MAG TPA: hypothetical protein VKP78_05550 [bacterium]|nr:hypothetical protein [bacterium]